MHSRFASHTRFASLTEKNRSLSCDAFNAKKRLVLKKWLVRKDTVSMLVIGTIHKVFLFSLFHGVQSEIWLMIDQRILLIKTENV